MTASRLREAAGSVRYPVERGRARRLAVGEPAPEGASRPRLLDRVRGALRARHYSRRTEDAYVAWIRRDIICHGKRHPVEMSAARSEEHTSELQSRLHLVCRLLLEKKKKKNTTRLNR